MSSTIPASARLEIKFVASETRQHAILDWLNRHRAGFTPLHPDRTVHNTYFDTFDYHCVEDNLSGASTRDKVRYRWYGDSDLPDAGVLEIKRKRNFYGWKLNFEIPEPPYAEGRDWKQIREAIEEHLPPDGQFWLKSHPFPIIINRYRRKYLADRHNRVRVTIDTKQAAWDQRFGPRPNVERRANQPDTTVIEFKFLRAERDYASDLMQGFPVRVSRHSKYITAVRAIGGLA